MVFEKICAPALIYIFFSITQIIMDISNGLINTAFLKLWVATLFTILLNYLCEKGLGVISWFIVFIPFIFMTVIISILLFSFGLDPSTGKINTDKEKEEELDLRAQYAKRNYIDNYYNNKYNSNEYVTHSQSQNNYMASSALSKNMNDVSRRIQDLEHYIENIKKSNDSNNDDEDTTSIPVIIKEYRPEVIVIVMHSVFYEKEDPESNQKCFNSFKRKIMDSSEIPQMYKDVIISKCSNIVGTNLDGCTYEEFYTNITKDTDAMIELLTMSKSQTELLFMSVIASYIHLVFLKKKISLDNGNANAFTELKDFLINHDETDEMYKPLIKAMTYDSVKNMLE